MAAVGAVTIVGAGPAGMAAAIYLQRAGFGPLLLEEKAPGGLLRQARRVENYPGFPGGISGEALADLLHEHLRAVGGSCTTATVASISRSDDGLFRIAASGHEHRTRAVVLATGTEAKKLDIDGTRSTEGRRVFYDLTELLGTARPAERIVVYGGGDAAFDMGLNLRDRGYEVTILCRSRARCLPLLRSRANQGRIAIVEGRSILRVVEGDTLSLELGGAVSIGADHLLIACGRVPRSGLLTSILPEGRLPLAHGPVPGVPGLYLAGDMVADGRRQVGIAIGSGMAAAMRVERYLREGTA